MVEGSKMPAALAITKRRFNVHEYHRMAEAGILMPRDRVQLIDGERPFWQLWKDPLRGLAG